MGEVCMEAWDWGHSHGESVALAVRVEVWDCSSVGRSDRLGAVTAHRWPTAF